MSRNKGFSCLTKNSWPPKLVDSIFEVVFLAKMLIFFLGKKVFALQQIFLQNKHNFV